MVKRILIVDDEELFVQGLARALQDSTTDVRTAATGKAALKEITNLHYNICFLDLCLPDIGWEESIKSIRELSPQTKVIVMTAGIITAKVAEYIEKEAYLYLTKPFDLLEIRMLTRRILEGAKSEITIQSQ